MKALVRYASILGLAAVLSACQSFPGSSDNDAETRHNVLTSDRLMIPAADGEGDMSSLPDDVDHQILGDLHRARQKLEHVRLNSANAEQDDDTVWARMLDLYALELEHEDPRLAHEIDRLTSKPAHFQKTLERARRYMYHIVNEIDARGLPGELALLPVVESAFDPFAYSRAHASGLWQFIPETGKLYGLEQNWWYDGRRDVVAATDAALRFLAELAEKYEGDWLLALAAYNSGPGTVSRAIARNQEAGLPTDFWSLDLPKETRAYVPRLLAAARVVSAPAQYGVTLTDIPDEPYFKLISTEHQMDLGQAAELAGIDLEELLLLNPGFNRRASAPNGPHRLLVPTESASTFKRALADLPDEQRIGWQHYRVRSGDSLAAVAKRFGASQDALKSINQLNSHRLRQGQTLLVPTRALGSEPVEMVSQVRPAVRAQRDGAHRIEYTVRPGDTLWGIAQTHGVGVTALASWNGVGGRAPLQAGQKMVIWSNKPPKAAQQTLAKVSAPTLAKHGSQRIGYQVRKGDSLYQIADRFNVSIEEILSWNELRASKHLHPGQQLVLYVKDR